MKKSKFITYSKLLLLITFTSYGQSNETSSFYDKIWDKVTLYENEENDWFSKFWLTGRLQGEYHSF